MKSLAAWYIYPFTCFHSNKGWSGAEAAFCILIATMVVVSAAIEKKTTTNISCDCIRMFRPPVY